MRIGIKKVKNVGQKGFSLHELLIVLMVVAILITLALPNIISARRLFRFSAMQRQVASSLRDAREEAIGQRTPVTFRYDNNTKTIRYYGGKFGPSGDSRNFVLQMSGSGLGLSEIVYGRPSGVSTAALDDGTNMTNLTSNAVEITFQADGSVINASRTPINTSMFFYMSKNAKETAFAVSVLGAGGRAKVWRYNKPTNKYVE